MSAKAKRILALLNDRRYRKHQVGEINLLAQYEPAQVGGGDQEMKVLKEMNELQDLENENWSRNG